MHRDGLALDLAGQSAEELQNIGEVGGLETAFGAQGLTRLEGEQQGELLGVGGQGTRPLEEQFAPVTRRQRRPARLGGLGGGDSDVHIVGIGVSRAADPLLGGRVTHVKLMPGHGAGERSVDKDVSG